MRILFFGSSGFSVPALQSIDSFVSCVVTRRAKPKGRGYLMEDGEVKRLAQKLSLPLVEMDSFKDAEAHDLVAMKPDLLVVVSFGLIIPRWFLDVPSLGAINVHPSLLPKYRGPAPIQWVIRNGDIETGITVIKMNERMDAGDILYQESVRVGTGENAETLSARLAQRTAELLPGVMKGIETGGLLSGLAQKDEEATYTPMIVKEMGLVDWATDPVDIVRQVRAFVAWPTAFTFLNGKLFKVFDADLGRKTAEADPGTVLEVMADGLLVSALGGSVLLKDVQLENRKRMSASEFARGYRGIVGKKFA
ncbi:MAG: methionyl-tRNA formyltransferase [Deltaproteobacteria bacterium]|nr:methionyl-tRNA formyltransferase [Deltaproteobacteria bacterium]